MQQILSDHNCEKQGRLLFRSLQRLGYSELIPMWLRMLPDVGLPFDADDESVWRLCQAQGILLLTSNRRTVDGNSSLELTARRLHNARTLPVVTIGDPERVVFDRAYCDSAAIALAEIVLDLENHRGNIRLYIP